jgi:predicted unusual protein kinase regulating ubiquinone biosynthesis (AarF/ABC1/UbiB family)
LLKPRSLLRLRHVLAVLIRHGFEDVLESFDFLSWVGLKRRKPRPPADRQHGRAEKLRLALEELGTTYIKLGQLLSTRPDLLSPVFIDELSLLQDRVAPLPFGEVKPALERELGAPLEELFERLDPDPLASASISQVYRARLKPRAGPEGALEGEVAVKVVRPGVPELVEVDIEIVKEAAERLSRSALGRRYDFKGLASQLETTLRSELDLHQEALNVNRIAESIREFPRLRVPRVAEWLTRRRVLVLEYVEGRKLTDVELREPSARAQREPKASREARAVGVEPHGTDDEAGLADELWRAYLKQILVDGAFHCDPHPGNLLLEASGKLAILDHGMMAFVSRDSQLRLMALLLALVDRDGDRVARVCLEMGIPGRSFREARFRSAVGHLVARYSGVTMKDLPFGLIVRDLLVLCLRNDIQIPPELVLLGKTLLNLEPLCRKLDPDLDPVRTMKDMAMRLVEEQFRRDLSAERLLALLLELRSFVYEVPLSARRVATQMANNELRVGIEIEKADEMQLAVRDVANRITLGVITAALILGSAFLLRVDVGLKVFGYPLFALVGFLMAAGLGIYVVAQILMGRH